LISSRSGFQEESSLNYFSLVLRATRHSILLLEALNRFFLTHFPYVSNPEATTTETLAATEILQHGSRLFHSSLGKNSVQNF